MKRLLSATLVLLVALGLGLSTGIGPANSLPLARASSFDDFPLWKDVIGVSFAKLDAGKLPNGTRWAAYASRSGSGKHWRDLPCVNIASITKYGVYGTAHGCGPLAPDGKGDPPILTSIEAHTIGEGEEVQGETVLAMSFQASITSIQMTTDRGETIRRKAQLLKGVRQRKAHLAKFRYVAVGLEKAICIADVTGYNEAGEVAVETPTERC